MQAGAANRQGNLSCPILLLLNGPHRILRGPAVASQLSSRLPVSGASDVRQRCRQDEFLHETADVLARRPCRTIAIHIDMRLTKTSKRASISLTKQGAVGELRRKRAAPISFRVGRFATLVRTPKDCGMVAAYEYPSRFSADRRSLGLHCCTSRSPTPGQAARRPFFALPIKGRH